MTQKQRREAIVSLLCAHDLMLQGHMFWHTLTFWAWEAYVADGLIPSSSEGGLLEVAQLLTEGWDVGDEVVSVRG